MSSNNFFGNSSLYGSNGLGGLDGNIIQQWQMLRANSAAYTRMLKAQQTGSVKQEPKYQELMSDKYFNENYDKEKQTYTKATYKPDPTTVATIDEEATAGDNLDSMRRLAQAAASGSGSLTDVHHDLFERLRQTIANNLDRSSGTTDDDNKVTDAATAASLTRNVDFRYLVDEQSFTVAGKNGESKYTFGVGETWENVVSTINADSGATGVQAETVKDTDGNITGITLKSTEVGKDKFVRVDQHTGDVFASPGATASAVGTDAKANDSSSTVATGDKMVAAVAVGVEGGVLASDQTFTLQGKTGVKEFSFAAGTNVDDIIAAINEASEDIGVTATAITGSDGSAVGIGLTSNTGGSSEYIRVKQTQGDLFGKEGSELKIYGKNDAINLTGGKITALTDLGRIDVNGVTYSFADLGPGGSASLSKNPDVATAIIDQTLQDIYSGKAVIKGFDIEDIDNARYVPEDKDRPKSTNTYTAGSVKNDALDQWLKTYTR
ncbi:MAG: hypothetical protein LIP23_09335 [Planctomycetes bacterium]|nr:hypothetical protein [Planctomycetota bacterium]